MHLDAREKIYEAVSREYVTKKETEKLAIKLLNGMHPMGGAGFISNRYRNGEEVNWSKMAYHVLQDWVIQNMVHHSIADGKVLLDAIEKDKPDAAHKFVNQLLGENGEIFFLL